MAKGNRTHPVVTNLIKILNDNESGRKSLFDIDGFTESKVCKILNGSQKLKVDELSKIATALNMREIDIYTYPKVFREVKDYNRGVKAQLTVELNNDLKDDVLRLVFGNSNLELINKT